MGTVKYDRPTSELLAECAAALPEPFTPQQIIHWFRRHYPDIKETTVRAHIQGLTESDLPSRRDYQFAGHRSVLERVGHGLYQRARGGSGVTATTTPTPGPTTAPLDPGGDGTTDLVLVGCVKSKRPAAAAARDLYTSTLFSRRRRYAEASGRPWFVVSARWGLVSPDEVIAPYDVHLAFMPADYRRAWGEFVTAQLRAITPIDGLVVEVHAGDAYVAALRPPLERAGAGVVDPVTAHSMGETLAWYDCRDPYQLGIHRPADPELDAESVAAALLEGTSTVSAESLQRMPRTELSTPGLYSWWVDEPGAEHLSDGLGYVVEPGVIYAGLAGATRWPSGKRSANTLWSRLVSMHLGGRARMSTFRFTLAATLTPAWGGGPRVDEDRLTRWMLEHLRVVAVPWADADTLGALERDVLAQLDPPLNLRGMPVTPLRRRLSRLRSDLEVD